MTREKAGESQIETTLPVARDSLGDAGAGVAGADRNSKTGCVGTTENSRLGDRLRRPLQDLETRCLLADKTILPLFVLELCDLYHSTMFQGMAIFCGNLGPKVKNLGKA
jgi:hypothetical protein